MDDHPGITGRGSVIQVKEVLDECNEVVVHPEHVTIIKKRGS